MIVAEADVVDIEHGMKKLLVDDVLFSESDHVTVTTANYNLVIIMTSCILRFDICWCSLAS